MAKPQLLVGAYDTGPSNYCRDVAVEGLKRNYGVMYLGNNPEVSAEAIYAYRYNFSVVGGPSSFESRLDQIMLSNAYAHSKPVLVLGDTPRSILRPGVKGRVGNATAVVASPSDIEPAKEFGYKDAMWVGYPSHWADPKKVKPANLNRADFPGLLVYVSGLKHAGITDSMLNSIVAGLCVIGVNYTVLFQEHPSEMKDTQDPECRAMLLRQKGIKVLQSRESVPSLMLTADISVVTGGSTGVMEAALLRLPVIYYLNDEVKKYMKKQVNEELWGPVAAGACEVATMDNMTEVLDRLIVGDGRIELKAKQEAAFPLQPEGLSTMDEIFKLLK
ncbi:MAG: hypothetical protein HYT37_02770 [Candidatus Sungbacteria bacterium]|nr:hypothetical protein [Candidatus Sungbacteria bacterium]